MSQFLQFAAVIRSSARSFSTSLPRAGGKIYEFRTYAVHPAKMRECMGVMEELLPFREKYSKLNGCWYTELGGLNEVNFLWEFGMFCCSLANQTTIASPGWELGKGVHYWNLGRANEMQ